MNECINNKGKILTDTVRIGLAALLSLGAGWYVKGTIDEIKLNSELNSKKNEIVLHIDNVDYKEALNGFDGLVEDMLPEKQKSEILNLKKKVQEISPTNLMRKGNSISTRLQEKDEVTGNPKRELIIPSHPHMEWYYEKDNLFPGEIHHVNYNLDEKLKLYIDAEKGFRSLRKPLGVIQNRIISTYLDQLFIETMQSNLDKHELSNINGYTYHYLDKWKEWRVDAPRYQNELLSYLKERKITNNPGIREGKLLASLDASAMLINNTLSQFPEENASKWIDYLNKTNEISKLFGISEQDRKEKLDPVKELISEYCHQKLNKVNLR